MADYTDWAVKYTIDISPVTPEANWLLRVELNSSNFDYSLCNHDGSDLRFSDIYSNALNYWIESWNIHGNSYIWIKIPTSSTATIWMWCNNKNAISESDYSTTLAAFDIANVDIHTNGYSSFFIFVNGLFIIAVKENGVRYLKATTSKYTWTVLSRSPYWDNPGGPCTTESGWNDYGTGAWNYQADSSGSRTMCFIGNGRSDNSGGEWHQDNIWLDNSFGSYYMFRGAESGGSSLNGGTILFFTAKGRSSETVSVNRVESVMAGVAGLGITVRLYERETGKLLGTTVSDGIDGTFSITTAFINRLHYALALGDSNANALIKDKIIGV